jgi:hypothetical protein
MTLKIKFSHAYSKMPWGCQQSMLLDVIAVKLEDLSKEFKEFDTQIRPSPGKDHPRYYPLPEKGDFLLLLLKGVGYETDGNGVTRSGGLWTTIRRKTPEKESYYRKNIGNVFECVVVP